MCYEFIKENKDWQLWSHNVSLLGSKSKNKAFIFSFKSSEHSERVRIEIDKLDDFQFPKNFEVPMQMHTSCCQLCQSKVFEISLVQKFYQCVTSGVSAYILQCISPTFRFYISYKSISDKFRFHISYISQFIVLKMCWSNGLENLRRIS